jgi:hypothetical protein
VDKNELPVEVEESLAEEFFCELVRASKYFIKSPISKPRKNFKKKKKKVT